MNDVIVLIGHGPGPNAIRSNLIDLATLGLVGEFVWVDSAADDGVVDVVSPNGDEGASVVPMRVADAVRSVGSGRVVLVVLDEPGADGPTLDVAAVSRWTNAIDGVLASSSERIHLVLPRLPLPAAAPAQMVGWSTFALAPEDSDAPGAAVDPQYRADGPDALARYAAPAVAGLTGLWAGSTTVPLLDGHAGRVHHHDSGMLRLVRVHHRRIDTTAMETGIRERTLDVANQVPQPLLSDGRRVAIAENDGEITGKMALGFGAAAREHLLTEFQPLKSLETVTTSAWESLKRFFAFFFKSVFGTPSEWMAEGSATMRRGFARMVQDTLYGQGSAIEVVCGNHSGSRVVQSVEDVGAASTMLRQELERRDSQIRIGAPPSAAMMWRAYTDSCLTLVDGGMRQQGGLAAPQDHSGNPVVVRQPRLSAPDSSDRFEGAHPTLTSMLGDSLAETTIEPYDPHGAMAYANALNYVADKTTDRSVTNLRSKFEDWRARHSTSFAWRVGEQLFGFMDESRERAVRCDSDLRRIQEELAALGPDDGSAARRMARNLRILWAVWAVVSLIIAYFVTAEYVPKVRFGSLDGGMPWNYGLFAFLAVTAVILVIAWFVFAKGNRGIYERIARRNLLIENERVAATNFGRAIGDVERCARAYAQHQSWSAIVGRAVNRPFGSDTGGRAPLRIPSSGLPRATVIAEARIDERGAIQAVNDLRNRVFPPSWAEDSFEGLVESAGAEVQARGVLLPADLQLHGAMGRGSGSPLDRIAQVAVDDSLDRSGAADEAWAEALQSLTASGRAGALMGTLRVRENGVDKEIPGHRFFGDVDGQPATGFSSASMSALGNNRGGTEIDAAVSSIHREPAPDSGAATTLSTSVTVIQVGRSARGEWITSTAPGPDTPVRGPFEAASPGTSGPAGPAAPREQAGPAGEPPRHGLTPPDFGGGLV